MSDPRPEWEAAAAVAVVGALVLVTTAIALVDGRPDSLLRHAYLVPVVAAALLGGGGAGVLIAAVATLLEAPFVLPYIEREGLDGAAAEGLVTLVVLFVAGGLTGTLAGAARRERTRHRMLLALGRTLAGEESLEDALERLRGVLAARLGVSEVALVLHSPERRHAGAADLVACEATATVVATGVPAFVPDAGGDPRPRRVFVAPVASRDGVIGALAVARVGEIGAGERRSLVALGAWLGLALENARLAARQRRFAAELEEKVASATRELEAVACAKSAFVATASHELRTPLTALRGFSELLARRRFPADEVRRFAVIMERETERLARIVEDLLDLSRLEQGLPPPLRRRAVEVVPAIEAAVALFDGEDTGRRVVVECDADLPVVDADPDALDRILKNLISNAVKYGPPGVVRVGARAVARAVELSVADRGGGIPPEALPRLFEPYFRVPEAARTARGSGIGLAVVKALVDAHGGSIGVESAPARGTRFRVTLPAAAR